jgi:hypothetical protein
MKLTDDERIDRAAYGVVALTLNNIILTAEDADSPEDGMSPDLILAKVAEKLLFLSSQKWSKKDWERCKEF